MYLLLVVSILRPEYALIEKYSFAFAGAGVQKFSTTVERCKPRQLLTLVENLVWVSYSWGGGSPLGDTAKTIGQCQLAKGGNDGSHVSNVSESSWTRILHPFPNPSGKSR